MLSNLKYLTNEMLCGRENPDCQPKKTRCKLTVAMCRQEFYKFEGDTVLPYDTVVSGNKDGSYDISKQRFKAPRTGSYSISVQTNWFQVTPGNAASGLIQNILVNGAPVTRTLVSLPSGDLGVNAAGILLDLKCNDELQISIPGLDSRYTILGGTPPVVDSWLSIIEA
jgi:hypothetical protein